MTVISNAWGSCCWLRRSEETAGTSPVAELEAEMATTAPIKIFNANENLPVSQVGESDDFLGETLISGKRWT